MLFRSITTAEAISVPTIEDYNTLNDAVKTYKLTQNASGNNPVDFTFLIKNADFEEGHVNVRSSDNGGYNQPSGWNLEYTEFNTNNNSVIADGKMGIIGFNNEPRQPQNGNKHFVTRLRWSSNGMIGISQTINGLPVGKYKLKAALSKDNNTATGVLSASVAGSQVASLSATTNSYEIYEKDFLIDTNNSSLDLKFAVTQNGQVDARGMVDNIQLEYYGVDPQISVDKETLSFYPDKLTQEFTIKGLSLSENIILTSSSDDFIISNTEVTPEEASRGFNVNVTFTGNTATEASITLVSAKLSETIMVSAVESVTSMAPKGIFFDQSLPTTQKLNVKASIFAEASIVAPQGIALSSNTITSEEAIVGKDLTVTWDGLTLVNDQYIKFVKGEVEDSILVFAANNLISSWDADLKTGDESKLENNGWSKSDADGQDLNLSTNAFGASGGVRLVSAGTYYSYNGAAWQGEEYRVAYLRGWGSPASYYYNLEVELEKDFEYTFRGVASWHNNENTPTFTYSVNTAQSNTGVELGSQSVKFEERAKGADYKFTFKAPATGKHYVTVTSDSKDDAMCAPMFLSVYEIAKPEIPTSVEENVQSLIKAYVNNKVLSVTGADNFTVYSINGVVVANCAGTESVTLAQGIYFVKANDMVIKVSVK